MTPKQYGKINGGESPVESIDLVVTVCDNAKESCPVFPKAIPAIHMLFHDPHGEPLESFVQVRDEIRAQLIQEVQRWLG